MTTDSNILSVPSRAMSAPPKSAREIFSRIRGARGAGEGSRWSGT